MMEIIFRNQNENYPLIIDDLFIIGKMKNIYFIDSNDWNISKKKEINFIGNYNDFINKC